MTIGVRCGSCDRELLLVQLVQPSQGFRCLFCGFAFAPGYATVAPGVAARAMAAHATLVTALTELQSMTGGRLRLDQATLVGPVANALPQVEAKAKEPALGTPPPWPLAAPVAPWIPPTAISGPRRRRQRSRTGRSRRARG